MSEIKYQGGWALDKILSLQGSIAHVKRDIEYQQTKLDALMKDLRESLERLETYDAEDFDWTIFGPIREMLSRLEPPRN